MKMIAFAKRTRKELLRDPLSYIFCVGFPIIMLLIMNLVDRSLPKEAHFHLFHISMIGPGISMFGLTFVMLFTAMQVSKDRSTALLTRMYASPMKGKDFIAGYTLPVIEVAVLQQLVTYLVVFVLGKTTDYDFQIGNMAASIILMIPSALLFIGFGLFFGTLLGEKSAPGICSIMISLAGMIGGIWMDVDAMGGFFKRLSHVLPFYHGTMVARKAANGEFRQVWKSFGVTVLYGVGIYVISVWMFERRRQKELR